MIENNLFITKNLLTPQVASGVVSLNDEAAANSLNNGGVGNPRAAAMDFLDSFTAVVMPTPLAFSFFFGVCGSAVALVLSMPRFYFWLLTLISVPLVISISTPSEMPLALDRIIVEGDSTKTAALTVFLWGKVTNPVGLDPLRVPRGPLFSVIPSALFTGVFVGRKLRSGQRFIALTTLLQYDFISHGVNLANRFVLWLGSFGRRDLSYEPFTFYHTFRKTGAVTHTTWA